MVEMSKDGSLATQSLTHAAGTWKGEAPARPDRSAPTGTPAHSFLPEVVRGPSQILRTTAASAAVMVSSLPSQTTVVPISLRGSKSHRDASLTRPSVAPSSGSQALAAASVKALNSQSVGWVFSLFMTTCGHRV